ncbi:hypothetical protein P4200_26650 [Pseudomonas aeruginosa]|nr:hypothetical protein [Pseudomonas aeruginosa]
MKKNVFVFSRLAPEHLERLQRQFNVRVLEPKQGDIDAQVRRRPARYPRHDRRRPAARRQATGTGEAAGSHLQRLGRLRQL